MRPRILAIIGILGSCSIAPVHGQIIPDGTTVDTSVLGDCHSSCSITGGTVAEQNLFHSFEEFNIDTGESVYFSDPGVANIFSRVTGTNLSEIFGTLGVSGGDANLFLINPNGIVFGEGATLDLNGSFFATTADKIQFGDRAFSTDPEVEIPLLTVDPSALFFNQTGQDGSIVLDGANLTVSPQQDLTLVGRESNTPGILFKNSTINVSGGNIFLGAVNGNATVEIKDIQPQFSEAVSRGDITLTQGSNIVADGSNNIGDREINLEAKNLEINENSNILTFTSGSGNSADININASESVKITGTRAEANAFQQLLLQNIIPNANVSFVTSALQTDTSGTGNAGDIKIAASNLTLDRAGTIISNTNDRGNSGNITIDVLDSFILQSSGLITGSTAFSSGEVGKVTIDTEQLLVKPGSVISSSTSGSGNAGNLTINALDSVQIEETLLNSILPTGIFANTTSDGNKGGNLTINTQKLSIHGGGQLTASSGIFRNDGSIPLGGQGGNILINADEFVEVGGISADGIFPSSISSATNTSNPAGNITINTGSLYLNSYGSISASSLGTGRGGNIDINATDTIELVGFSNDFIQQLYADLLTEQPQLENIPLGLTAFTVLAGDTGNISIATPRLSLELGAIITTGTVGTGNAGNIKIAAGESIDVNNSLIAAPSLSTGNAGNINLDTKNLNITDGGGIVSISSSSGDAGDINILARESIELFKTTPDVVFPGTISTASYTDIGFPGNLTIATKRLSIRDGSNIQTDSFSIDFLEDTAANARNTTESKSAKLTINASKSIEISGSNLFDNRFSATENSQISSTTNTANSASDIKITTGKLSLFNGGEISVNSLGTGTAGSLEVIADSISLDNNASLNGTTLSGRGGNIALQVNGILDLENESKINTNSVTFGDGGNINIAADFVIASDNSSISANALALGNGGNVDLDAIDLFVDDNSKITANSQEGIDGTVNVRTSFDSDRYSYANLSQKVIPTENVIVRRCGSNNTSGAFTYTGKGGLPANPLEFQTDNTIIADLDIPEDLTINNFEVEQVTIAPPSDIVEAEEWRINQKGNVELVASSHSSNASIFNTACPL